jgi:hypothetical protein
MVNGADLSKSVGGEGGELLTTDCTDFRDLGKGLAEFAGGGLLRRGGGSAVGPGARAAILRGSGRLVVRKAESFSQEVAKITKILAQDEGLRVGLQLVAKEGSRRTADEQLARIGLAF